MDFHLKVNPKLPPEIISLVLDALETDRTALKNCSLTCTAWRALSLPVLFDTLKILDGIACIQAVRFFMFDSPYLRPYIRRMSLRGPQPYNYRDQAVMQTPGAWLDDVRLVSFLTAFPKLIDARYSFNPPLAVLASALPQIALTTLQLDHYSPSAHDLLRLLVAGSKTLRSVALEYISCHTPLNTTTQDITTTTMGALEELHVNYCSNLPLEGAVLQMPGLQRLFLGEGGVVTPPSCLPDSLKTLGVDAYPDGVGPPSSRRFRVENICLISPGYSRCLYEVHDTINRYTIPSSIRHIEILLFENVRTHPSPVEFGAFEAFLLTLHESGRFSRLTVTMWGMPNAQAYSLSRFTQLGKRGLVELRVGMPSVLYPRSFEVYGYAL